MGVGSDNDYMNRALALAAKAKGKTSPNPMVGAVIVKGNKIVGEGFHTRAGAAHAEIVALRKAGTKARGGTIYVTLEPCCHTGRTGPCVEAIIKAGVKRVVYSIKDPNPKVNGRGARRLRGAGLEVLSRVLQPEAVRLNEIYLTNQNEQRPLVILKSAQSLDGRIAAADGSSQWISSAASLKYGHRLRAEVDAVVVGAGTARTDNPRLTVRKVKGEDPYRIILSRRLELPLRLKLFTQNQDRKTIVVSTAKAIANFCSGRKPTNLTFWELPLSGKNQLDLERFLSMAYEFGLCSILVEGGSKLATSFMRAGLVDKYVCIISPVLIGWGADSMGDLGQAKIADSIKFSQTQFVASGSDMIFTGYPRGVR